MQFPKRQLHQKMLVETKSWNSPTKQRVYDFFGVVSWYRISKYPGLSVPPFHPTTRWCNQKHAENWWRLLKLGDWLVGGHKSSYPMTFCCQVMAPKPPISSTLLGTFHQTSLTWILSLIISTRFQKKNNSSLSPFNQARVKSVDLPPKCAPDPRTFPKKKTTTLPETNIFAPETKPFPEKTTIVFQPSIWPGYSPEKWWLEDDSCPFKMVVPFRGTWQFFGEGML